MLTPEKEDSIGHDPVEIRDYWFTGDYLTIIFRYGGGGTIHFITWFRMLTILRMKMGCLSLNCDTTGGMTGRTT